MGFGRIHPPELKDSVHLCQGGSPRDKEQSPTPLYAPFLSQGSTWGHEGPLNEPPSP